ncbi:ATP-binding protein [Calothrix sp. PCC 7507]|uniref:PAS domain-containing sensor histidine kinase n=1 Tax=Calothrix sp. PCC 7507 TaxID=99598 RepID=UPI00029ECC46|nr:ATP-binding protein [Calothrix sp. PCC 7507]AFY32650.1 PAS/PAC sensor signal transduction histidine kinase [Calothrix sp. PCC 7507]
MNLDGWSLEIQNMRQRIAFLQHQSEKPEAKADIKLIAAVFEEIHLALEELQIANEDLQRQNEELSITQQAFLKQRQRYQELFEEAPEAYVVTDMKGVIQEANFAATNLLNNSKSFLIGAPLDIYVVDEEKINFHLQLKNLHDSSEIQEWEVNLQPLHKTPIIVAVKVVFICRQPNQLVELRWLLRDITVAKRTQAKLQLAEEAMRRATLKEKELSKLKSHLLVTTSHEFRNPLATIHSSAELLEHYRHKWSDERQVIHFHRIQKSVMYMTQLLNDLLLLSQDENSKLQFHPAPLNLVEFSREILDELQQDQKTQHAIAFHSEYQCIQANFDAKLLRHIFNNLLSNALKYSPIGSTIKFSLTYAHNQAILQIQDRGIGIPPNDIEHIFECFHRASNVDNIPGMGLGMSIVKKAVDLHSGEIAVDSLVGIGTTFTLNLPTLGDLHIQLAG